MWVFRKISSISKSKVSYESGKTILLKLTHRQKRQDALYCVKMSIDVFGVYVFTVTISIRIFT